MGEWSERAKERAQARKEYQMDEACECIRAILNSKNMSRPGEVVIKRTLFKMVVKCCEDRRIQSGVLHIPTIENTEVRPVDIVFLRNNWSDLCDRLAEDYTTYVIWEGGRNGGVRLGTLEEYATQQKDFKAISRGVVNKHNRRSDIINDAGEDSDYLGLLLGAPDKG